MSPVTRFPDLDRARNEAAEWIARTFRGLTAEENVALRDWSRRPENRRAMQEMSGVWQGMDVLSVLAEVFPAKRAPRWRTAVAASLLVAITAGVMVFALRRHDAAGPHHELAAALQAQVYSSTIGEHRTIRLDDGSTLSLNSDTLIDVAYTPGLRSLSLHRGEAHFEVAQDAARPFLVIVNGRTVRAVGTAFNVRRRSDADLDLLVTEGVVSTYAADRRNGTGLDVPADAARLSAGQLLRVRSGNPVQVVRLPEAELEAMTSWQRGVLVLDGITLEAALAEARRYTTRRLVIDDASLGGIRLGGSFRTDDLSPLFRALEANFGIVTHEDADGTLRLRRATPRE